MPFPVSETDELNYVVGFLFLSQSLFNYSIISFLFSSRPGL